MIEAILNLLLHCHHRRISRPVAPIRKHGIPQGESYVVCLDCGQQFEYDTREMRIGKPLVGLHLAGMPREPQKGSRLFPR